AKITITYAESLYDDNGSKGDRNIIEGKKIHGNEDIYLSDGGYKRLYSPLYYRTFRYVKLHIENHQEPLEINDFYSVFTAYPFSQVATFKCNDSVLNNIFETGWRTARLCAFETYMDCPYYEQLQYLGDTRIQALISLYVSGDDRLMRNAIEQINYSMLPEGITQSRYPSSNFQVIPPISLFWISMLHDYWMLRKDDAFIRSFLPSVKKILDWHKKYINENNMLGPMPYWNFVDWAKQWPWTGSENGSGVPDGTKTGNSSILTLQYVMALQKGADLYNYFQLKSDAGVFINTANQLKKAVLNYCWNNDKKLLANTISKNTFSQHAQALGVLTGIFPKAEEKKILIRTISDTSLIQCTYYYKFYLFQALKKAGMASEYVGQLSPWKKMLALHLSTFAEAPEPTRSDCHGWSASPCYDLLATLCGINPSVSGFEKVIINPHLGVLTECEASMPHPRGIISVRYKKLRGNRWEININLPQKLTGNLVWDGKAFRLNSGKNSFKLKQLVSR
ncbi:MAG: alpha-L-rhamnosidase C-terminal domain-containing protein, partial [Ginsengibacter sp.]